jgi:hypothetical protein
LAKQLFSYAILSFVLIKVIALFALMMVFLINLLLLFFWNWDFGGNKYIFATPYLQNGKSSTFCPSWVKGYAQKILFFNFPNKMNTSRPYNSYV